MRTAALALSVLACGPALALGPYACRPAQMFGGTGSPAVISVTQASSCAVWSCGNKPQVAVVKTSALTDQMRADWASLLTSNSGSPLNSMRDKHAKDDPCTTLWDSWAACRSSLTAAHVRALCPGR